jgi:AcrR family transcriptional regulator
MKNKQTRTYNSIIRQKQAGETRTRIADAAEELIKANGYEHTTIGEIANKAGVATQTVYAVFNSKQGIFVYLLRRALLEVNVEVDYSRFISARSKSDIAKELAAMIGRQSKEHISIVNILGGVDKLYPELFELIEEANAKRRDNTVEILQNIAKIRNITLTPAQEKTMTDIFWTFTDNALYYKLVINCKWSYAQYELFLQKILEAIIKDIASDMFATIKD